MVCHGLPLPMLFFSMIAIMIHINNKNKDPTIDILE